MVRRTYTSELRARSARETRATILAAARTLFAERGYARTSVAAVAAAAGVALNTVYTSVGGKPALVLALAVDASADELIEASLDRIGSLTDGREILREAAEGTGEVTRRQAATLGVLLESSTSEPAVAAAAEVAVGRYRARLARVADRLMRIGALREGVDQARAEEILWFYFGTSAWTAVRDLDWTWPDATDWLATQAAGALLR
jgi:AcrR family transcriptional regulator